MSEGPLTHLDRAGRARMVDVAGKEASDRRAVARAIVKVSPDTAELIERGDAPKGDVISTARIAAVQAAKRTDELIPLAHPLPLDHVDVAIDIDTDSGLVEIVCRAKTTARTGVEMEAMTACAVAALTIYDMVKGVERGVTIEKIELLEKTGGKKDWFRSEDG